MGSNFARYSRKRFEYELSRIKKENTDCVGYWKDITEEIRKEQVDFEVWEYIYSYMTKNISVQVLIFSSVDSRYNCTRDYGKDAVRLVYKWKTKNGFLYKRIGRHNRTERLFELIEKTIVESCNNVFNMDSQGWGKLQEVLF